MLTLTDYEQRSIRLPFDLANGHAYQEAFPFFEDALGNLKGIWQQATQANPNELEERLRLSFATLIGSRGLKRLNQSMICPTASNSIDIVAAYTAYCGTETLLVEPTFDNLALLFRRRGNRLWPISEDCLAEAISADALDVLFRDCPSVGALFIVNPNNPTGQTLDEASFRALCTGCERNGVTLIVDNSFRMFNRQLFDDYSVMLDSGVSFIAFEDTGKCWPTLDLKLSMMFASSEHLAGLGEFYRELYLGPSPFSVALFREIFEQTHQIGVARLVWDLVDERRMCLREVLQGSTLTPLTAHSWSPLPVEWIRIDQGGTCDVDVCAELARRGLGVLPGRHFFWNSVYTTPIDGFIRVSLLKPADEFANGVRVLRQCIASNTANIFKLPCDR
jgi:aspartate/methionine/tyrosine aminotransferase